MSAGVPGASVALTFDDGPDAVWTPIVLRRLARLGVRATFFVVAPRALRLPHVVRAMRDEGHAVELHCWDHVRHSHRTRRDVERDADRALAALAGLGVSPSRWRTPWGDTAPWTADVAAARGLALTGWTADTHDWRGDTAERMLEAVRPGLLAGAVVLMHDGIGPGATRADCLQTVRLLEPLCAAARAAGLGIAPPSAVAEPSR